MAQEAGEDRKVALGRTVLQLNEQHLGELRAQIEALLLDANDHPDGDGVWTTVVWTTIDREDRRAARSPRATARRARSAPTTKSSPQD